MTTRIVLGGLLALAGVVVGARPAAACGGCFGPTGQPTVVTAHRMAISLSAERTILWDQFEYAGSPDDFVWVLPVAGDQDVRVELAENAFFQALQQATTLQLQGPFTSRGGGGGGFGFGCGAAGGAPAAEGPSSDPVVLYYEGTVGPYETVTIGSEDPEALLLWLQERGYNVPDAMLPTIEHYVGLEMNFVALRLSPGESVTRMQPVRVVTRGLNVSFPLRMVAAGVADHVALELFVIAEGRYEAAGFPNGEVDRGAIAYDWATATYNYDELAEAVVASEGGRTWLTEYAEPIYYDGEIRYFSVTDEGGETRYASEDWTAAVEGLSLPYVTRMRADLPVEALGEDLVLMASSRGDLGRNIFVDREINAVTASLRELDGRGSTAMAGLPGPVVVLLVAGAGLALRRRLRG